MHHLPPGCALWRATGGPLAWSDEMHLLSQIEYWGQIADWRLTKDGHNGSNPPDAHRPPLPGQDAEAAESQLEAKVRRHQERALAREAYLATQEEPAPTP